MALIRSSKLLNLAGSGPAWYTIRNATDGPAQVNIYGEIGYVGITAQQFLDDIAGLDAFELHLNTPGGEVYDGIAIYEGLKQRGGVPIVVDSLAASIGSVIAMAGEPLVMAKNSSLMIHDGYSMACGNAADMRKMADLLDMASDTIAGIYAEKSGRPAAYWRDLMRGEKWFKAQEAVDEGLADQVKGQQRRDTWNLADFGYRNADLSEVHGHPGQACWDPDGDGDCDLTPEADTDHDYWAPDGTQLKPVPGKPMTTASAASTVLLNEKYSADDRKRMAGKEAMDDGSYPIADAEDLSNAIQAVGEGNASHDAIRRHIISRAKALGLSSRIPDNWGADGSLNNGASDSLADLAHVLRNAL